MSRTFAYARVSTVEQEPQNQLREIEMAGFNIRPHRIIAETVSGSMAITQRKGFVRLIDKMEKGDVLVVTKLDRLGRDAIDVSTTVTKLEEIGIRVHCLGDVNEAPTSVALSNNSVDENADGAVIGSLTVSDVDAGDSHTFTVSDSRFEVVNGDLKLKAGESLDHETESSVSVDVTASDSGNLSTTQTFSISVGDVNEAPTSVALSNNSVDENADGAVIGALTVSDVDAGDSHTFTVSDSRFEVVNGDLKLKAGETLDFETEETISIDVTATDSGNLSTTQTFSIAVNDINENTNQAPTSISVSPNLVVENAAGALIGAVTVTDPDPDDTHTFTISDSRFEIVNGDLRLKAGESLDYETETNVNLLITATDQGGLSVGQNVNITVADVDDTGAPLALDSSNGADVIWRDTGNNGTFAYINGDSSDVMWMGVRNEEFIVLGDFDGNAEEDALWHDGSNDATYAFLSGDMNNSMWMGFRPEELLSVSDFNGDGQDDALWRDTTNNATYAYLGGDTSDVQWFGFRSEDLLGVADFNGDGEADTIWHDTTNDATYAYLSGDSSTVQWMGFRTEQLLTIADFNGDGQDDTLWQDTTSNATYAYLSGDADSVQWMGFRTEELLTVADFNGDGEDDTLWRDTTSDATYAYLSGDTDSVQWFGFRTEELLAVADFNGDGEDDALWHDTSNNATYAYLSGDSTTVQWMGFRTEELLAVADFDADGQADTLWRDTSNNATYAYMSGDTSDVQWYGFRSEELLAVSGTDDTFGLIS